MNPLIDKWRLDNVKIVLDSGLVEGSVVVENGVIAAVVQKKAGLVHDTGGNGGITIIDGAGGILLPGFIDVHVHGGYGADFMDASKPAFDTITRFHASKGTTTMLATTVTASREAIEAVLEAAAEYMRSDMPYAALAGVHLEGPFISELWPGAQNPAYISPPRMDWVDKWVSLHPGIIKQLTLAPEKEGALELIKQLARQGIVAACGHTDAVYADIMKAADAGLSQAVHTYNAMRGLHHREPGTVGAVLTDARIYAEIIADGHHVHPAAVRLLAASKPADKLILITDAIAAAGLGDGEYDLGGLTVDVRASIARLREGGSLAGSTLTMIDAFRFMLEHTNLTVSQVSRIASANPARQLGLQQRTGSIAIGKQADLVLASESFTSVLRTWVGGRQVYAAD
ncbi:N-acetylglucosamine-6-phosphate deacetylase [Paenibacillus sp. sptzw28]|uniref:N-acetylglucosamine-6-phosphate deacetylase n=1 Tax=Paenibacillus sp. sptzw28 TaxID=715179 RepID=UPI001C6E2C19|nr:N-acetylglucosamine-6-phosphate deacetylase [Paenibacillus sp. sptzw28]QYR20382.1 N-acetylglucosamine-6-phosphate deacetylase [Paenibacillus sp. sptzw28]